MKRALLLFLVLAACGPSAPASHTIADERAKPSFSCPTAAPTVKTDPAASDALLGQTIVHVCVVGGSSAARDVVSSSLGTKSGAKLDGKRVHDDLLAVMDLPMIDDATVSATRSAAGLDVFFAIKERPVIASVEFEGVHVFTRGELDVAPIAQGQHLDLRALRLFTTTLQKAYDERGYGSAKVDYAISPMDPGKVRVVITAREGVAWHFGPIAFQGNKVLTTADLAKAIEMKTGDKWNADVLERAPLLAQALAYNRGLIDSNVKVDHAAADGSGAVPVTFTIHEGDVFVLRKISITGVPPAVEKQTLAAMKAKPKMVFARDVLMADLEAMRAKLGMAVEPKTELDPKTKSVDLVLEATKTP